MKNILAISQVIVSLAIIVLILLQERSAGLSGIFGGDGNSFYQTRRGMEKTIFAATIGLAVIFLALSIAQLLV
ncbi:MAG TPA: preprotein translocase subunit SecG [Candidatus Paceibacterota bacterium]|nr:preprotein translocase subunit SecG [Candidatus Paceibacterota bacterium]